VTEPQSAAARRGGHPQDLFRRATALIFDVDGTLAETEELHRQSFNEAFLQTGLGWWWDRAVYKKLLRVTGFDAIVAGDEVPHKKPAPDVYVEALARLGLSAAECLAIEDSANGLISASRAGIAVVIARSTYFRDDDFAEALLVVDDLSELA
jgi:beta-phosphoglucomutase-like phosphatase (HAD superfamily)